MLALLLSAFGLGLAYCAPPGAVTAEALRRGIAGGFWPALRLELGSLLGDAAWSALALVGAAAVVQRSPLLPALGFAGGLLLLRLAWRALAAAHAGEVPKPGAGSGRGAFLTGAALSLANPWALAFWFGVGGAIVGAGSMDPRPADFAVFFAGFMLAAVAWCFALAALIAGARRRLGPAFFRWINLLCGLLLLAFGLRLLLGTAALIAR